MNNLYDLFIPVDQLKEEEPEFFHPFCESSHSGSVPSSPGPSLAKTAVSILEEGCKKVYSEQPIYKLLGQSSVNNVIFFTMECLIMGVVGTGMAKTKKIAKQLAAKEALKGIVKKGRYQEFNIPGKTKDEAYMFLECLVSDEGGSTTNEGIQTSILTPNENWVGRVMELCQRVKIESPRYSDEQLGPPNSRTFKSICEVNGFRSEGMGKTKKAAKAESARSMFSLLEKGLKDMDEDLSLYDVESEDEELISPVENQSVTAARIDPEPQRSLEEMLSNPEHFSSHNMEYKQLSLPNTNGEVQVLLRIKFTPVNESGRLHIFPGTGNTLAQAQISAARNALITINTFAIPLIPSSSTTFNKKTNANSEA